MLVPVVLLLFLAACAPAVVPTPLTDAAPPAGLTVAWVVDGNLWLWRAGAAPRQIAGGDVGRAMIAPDGQHIAFTRGSGSLPTSLWLTDGSAETEWVTRGALGSADDSTPLISLVTWLDANRLVFNTVRLFPSAIVPADDLWRATVTPLSGERLLPPGSGGAFTISPDQRWIAVVQPGEYGQSEATLSLMDTSDDSLQQVFAFAAISPGSNSPFYAPVFWEPDSRALRLAVPDPDLIYNETIPTALWRVPVAGEPTQIGAVPASFFGLPAWSSDGARLTYLQRTGASSDNRFDLVLADGDGQNAAVMVSGQAGSLEPGRWLPDTDSLVFVQSQPGETWLVPADAAPRRLPASGEALHSPIFLDAGWMVYATRPGETFELRYARVDEPGSGLIALVEAALPIFDAVRVRP